MFDIKSNVIDIDCGMYLAVGSLMRIRNITSSSNNITLRKVNVKPYGFDKNI